MSKNDKLNPQDKRDITADEAFEKRVMSHENMTGKLPKEIVEYFMQSKEAFIKDAEESKSFDIQVPYLVEISIKEPFFGSLSRRIEKIRTFSIPTAGVTATDGHLSLYWNPIFFYKVLKYRHVFGALKHELYHLVFEHMTTRRQSPHVLWNTATDLAINSLIPINEIGEGWLVPGVPPPPPPKNAPANWKPSAMCIAISKMPRAKTSEWYMSALLNDKDIQQAMKNARAKCKQGSASDAAGTGEGDSSGPGGKSSDNGDSNGPRSKPSDKDGSKNNSDGEKEFNKHLTDELFDGQGGQFDDHDMWDEMSSEEKDMMRDAMRDIFRSSIREAEGRHDGWGTVPTEVQQQLKEMISKEIDWRELVNQFIGRCKSTTRTSSIKRINRRFPWEHPGRKRAYSARPLIAFDQSGSMHNEWVELFFGELTNLGNVTEYDILPFDHTIDEKNMQTVVRGSVPNIKRTRHGGTCFNAPIEYVNKHPGRWDVMFILTDGECVANVKPNIPIAYILAPGCEMYSKPSEDVQVIKLPKNAFKNR